jgi:glyoxylase-like metal-dependent hydrolase (beta-lactamase superfamily II)
MRLTEDVYLVGGGTAFAFGLSENVDSHVYCIDGGGELALIDCGMATGGSFEDILRNLRDDGLDPGKIGALYVTHYHADHAFGAAAFRERLGLKVGISHEGAAALRTGDEYWTGFGLARASGFYAADLTYPPCAVDRELRDGDTLRVGELELTMYESPGHCNGHGCYLLQGRRRRYLFTGDCVFFGGEILLQNIPDCNIQRYAESVAKLARLEYDAFLPGHQAISLRDGTRHVRAAHAVFSKQFPPKQMIV